MKGRSARRAVLVCGVLAASLLPAAPAGAVDVCRTHSQPGFTVTVGPQQVRIPAVSVSVCVDGPDAASLVPGVFVVTGPVAGSTCTTNCFAVFADFNPSQPGTTVSVSVTLDGNGVSQTKTLPVPGGNTRVCLFAIGFPDPPIAGCLVRVDPDN